MEKDRRTVAGGRRKTYGECQLCGSSGSFEFHHLIPKRLNLKSRKSAMFFVDGDDIKQSGNKHKLEELMIKVCYKCHRLLHPENIEFYKKSTCQND